jgi:hypothetical protein
MRAVIVLMVLTVILHLGLRYYITPQFSQDVRDRFIERGRYIPSLKGQHLKNNDGRLTASNLLLWISDPANQVNRLGYVTPVILPLDVLFLISLGSLLGCLSQLLASRIGPISGWPVIVWWLFPITYLVCDFIEDGLIVSLLSWPGILNPLSFSTLRVFTIAKISAVTIAFLQSGALLLGWVAARLGIL